MCPPSVKAPAPVAAPPPPAPTAKVINEARDTGRSQANRSRKGTRALVIDLQVGDKAGGKGLAIPTG